MEVSNGIKRTAVLCILQHQNQFLLLKRLKEPNKDTFTPIGGKLEPNENPNVAAIRETYEETGIQISDIQYVGSLIETSPTNYNWNNLVYLAKVAYQEPPICNEGTLEWIKFEDLNKIPTPKTDWFIYQYVAQKQPFFFNAQYNEHLDLLWLREEIEGKNLDY